MPTCFRSLTKLSLVLSCFLFTGCEQFDFNPYDVRLQLEEQDLNKKNLEKITAPPIHPGDTLRFAVISDTQRFYDELEACVTAINKHSAQIEKIDFVINNGDLTDYGLAEEFKWSYARTKKFNMPYLAVIGNHDCVAKGQQVYEAMFGPTDFTMQVARYRFIFLNTNSLEYAQPLVPDINFMRGAFGDTAAYDQAFVISHVPPFDAEFDRNKTAAFAALIRQNKVSLAIHGHQHSFRFTRPFKDGQGYLITGDLQERAFYVVTAIGKKASFKKIDF